MLRDGLADVIGSEPDMVLIGEAESGKQSKATAAWASLDAVFTGIYALATVGLHDPGNCRYQGCERKDPSWSSIPFWAMRGTLCRPKKRQQCPFYHLLSQCLRHHAQPVRAAMAQWRIACDARSDRGRRPRPRPADRGRDFGPECEATVTTLLATAGACVERSMPHRYAGIPNGAGDLFAGLLLGHLLNGLAVETRSTPVCKPRSRACRQRGTASIATLALVTSTL